VIEDSGLFYLLPEDDWDKVINRDDLENVLSGMTRRASVLKEFDWQSETLAPIGHQEVWAAGVTYYRSRTARIEGVVKDYRWASFVKISGLAMRRQLRKFGKVSPTISRYPAMFSPLHASH